MKTQATLLKSSTKYFAIMLFAFLAGSIYSNKAMCQIDYNFARRTSGFRLGLGVGEDWLQNNFRENPVKPTYAGTVEYNVNEYFSLGLQGQMGELYGENSQVLAALPYAPIRNNYVSAGFNMHFGVGLLSKFESRNGFTDLVKRSYVGTGLGYINSNISFYQTNVSGYSYKHQSAGYYLPFNLGTSFDLRKLTGTDRFELNPEYQFNMVNDQYFQGFTSIYSTSTLRFYSQFTLNLKYKF